MTNFQKKTIVGNWKMNGSTTLVGEIIQGIASAAGKSNNDIVVIPPFVYLSSVIQAVKGANITVGAQNLSEYSDGAYTGEVSGVMLSDVGCQYVLVGHSERRQLFGETDMVVAKKVQEALASQVVPILCVGETLVQRESGEWKLVVERQLKEVVNLCGIATFEKIIVAYEPVWAIGTGKSASAEIANEVHEYIYCTLAGENDKIRSSLRVLYGGSVTAENSAQYMSEDYIDGVLVGGASLKPSMFSDIILSVE